MANKEYEIIVTKDNLRSYSLPSRNKIEYDEPFCLLERKLTRELLDRKLIKSFKEIKKLDRIEISTDNYISISKTNFLELNTSLYMFIPFITKGVMVLNLLNDTNLYFHFTVTEIDLVKENIKICLDIYTYENNYYAKVIDFTCILSKKSHGSINCEYKNIKHNFEYYYDLINDKSNSFYLTEPEKNIFESRFDNFADMILRDEDLEKNHGTLRTQLMQTFMYCFVYLNNCIEAQNINKKKSSSISNSGSCNRIIKVTKSKDNKVKDQIIIINGIKIKKGENSLIKTRQGNIIINRQTQVWGVIGHFRHYKNGKTIYIQPYKKGPGRNKEEVSKTIYKLKTNEE